MKAFKDTSKILWRPLGIHQKCYEGLLGYIKDVTKASRDKSKMLKSLRVCQKCFEGLLGFLYKGQMVYIKSVTKVSQGTSKMLQRLLRTFQNCYEGL